MDKNFTKQDKVSENVVWYDARELALYGLVSAEPFGVRMPAEVAKKVNSGVDTYSRYTAGGRVRFSTDSSFVALRVQYAEGSVPTVNNHCVSYGFDLYRDEAGIEVFTAAARPVAGFDYQSGEFKMLTGNGGKKTCYTLNFPVFAGIKSLRIGIGKDSCLGPGKDYRNRKPVVFYGSSITHGAAAGRPGNTYESFISQKYNLDYVNLGFAGSARGEQVMAEYIAGLDMGVFVCDYDHNALTAEHLQETHFKFYETIRKYRPDVPYIMISRPNFFAKPKANAQRRQIIRDSYEKAEAQGDEKVFFIDGETLFAGAFAESCTSDGVHPNDLGFYRMAQVIGPVVDAACKLTGDY